MATFTRTAVAMVIQENTSTPSLFSALQKLRGLLTVKEKKTWALMALLALFVSGLEIVTASLIMVFAQVLSGPEFGQKWLLTFGITESYSQGRLIFYFAIAVGMVFLLKNIVAAAEAFYQNISIQSMCYEFKNKLLKTYAQSDYGFYLTRNSSFGMSVVAGDAEQTFSGGMTSVAAILSEGIVFCCLVVAIIMVEPTMALIIAGLGSILGIVVFKLILPKFYRWGQTLQETGVQSTKSLMQFFHAFKEISLLGKTDVFINHYQYYSRQKSRVLALQNAVNAMPRMCIEVLFVGLFVAAITYLCMGHETPLQMIGILSGYLYAGFRLMPGLNRIINQLNTFKSAIPYIDRAYKEYTTVASEEYITDEPGLFFEQSVVFHDVSFQYLNTHEPVLKGINLEIIKGSNIGITGKTGSGKSTLIDLLLGLLRPTKGRISIDSDYATTSKQWHRKIGYVPQSVYLTDDTIAANIAFGERDIDEQRLKKAIKDAQLSELVQSLPQSYHTIVGERGVRLSGGERQRIAIARALYRDPEVLIFDEATSALDNQTESQLMETIDAVSINRTVIMIAHRLSTLKNCDQIIHMSAGEIKSVTDYEGLLTQIEKKGIHESS